MQPNFLSESPFRLKVPADWSFVGKAAYRDLQIQLELSIWAEQDSFFQKASGKNQL